MRRRALHLMLAFGLALGVFAGTALTAGAQDEPSEMYFPWVPNGAEIDDDRNDFGTTGPYDGTITVQNLEDAEIEVHHETTATGETDSETVDAHETLVLTSDHLFDPGDPDGSGVRVWAEFTGEGEGAEGDSARIAAVEKQAQPDELSGDAGTDEDHETVAGYTGLAVEQLGDDIVLPIVQTNSNWNTLIRVTNFDDDGENGDSTDITLTLHQEGGGSTLTHTVDDVEPGETASVDLLSLNLSAEWVGSAEVSADDEDVNVGAVAERVKNETSMLIMNTSEVQPEDGDEQYAPLVFNSYNFWNTGIGVADLSGEENEVTVTYYDLEGDEIGDPDVLELPANGMDFIYTPTPPDGEGDGFVGSAVVESDGEIAGAVDEVKYFGDDPNTGHAMSYMLEDHGVTVDESLAMPLVQKGEIDELDVVHGDTSGIHIFNPSDEWAVVGITYLDEDGNTELTDVQLLQAKEGYTSYTGDIDELDENFQGSAVIQNVSGDGTVVGASNNVNYDVEFDGSASFNLIHTGEISLLPPDPLPDSFTVDPDDATNDVGTEHSITVTVEDDGGAAVQGATVIGVVVDGPHDGDVLDVSGETDAQGEATLDYEGTDTGRDEILIHIQGINEAQIVTKTWEGTD